MSTDPFLIVKEEVLKSLAIAEKQLVKVKSSNNVEKNVVELSNTFKSISWDLEDLAETVAIVEKDPHKFPVAYEELANRKRFVEDTKARLSSLRKKLERVTSGDNVEVKISKTNARFTSINIDENVKEPIHKDYEQVRSQQQLLLQSQDDHLERLGGSVSVLQTISKKMGSELDDQAVLLDDVSQEMDKTESRIDTSMKKMARLMHLTTDKRQWCAIGILLAVVIILIVILSAT